MQTIPARSNICISLVMISLLACSCHSKENLFVSVSPSSSNIHFANTLESQPRFNILYYLYYYNGGGVATGDINNDGLADIYFTANSRAGNKLYLNKGNFQFEDITEKAGVAGSADWCTGVTMADVNGDHLLDIYVSAVSKTYNLKGHNELFINNGDGSFKEKSAAYGLDFAGRTTQSAFFDYDHDGDLDCYILNQSHHPHANISDTSYRHKVDSLSGDRLYRNDVTTTGKFTDVSAAAGIYQSSLGYGLGLAVSDINNDGWDDLYIGNDFHENDYYYVNNRDGTFSESGAQHFKHYSRFSMGNDVADFNNDGQLDVITLDMLPDDEKILKSYGSDENPDTYKLKLERNGYQQQYSKNCLQMNNGNGISFSEIGLMSGVAATDWSWSPLLADFDNDGNKDLFISSGIVKRPVDLDYIRFITDPAIKNQRQESGKYDEAELEGMPDGASHPYLFKGDGKFSFQNKSIDWGTSEMKGYFNGASYADLDNDGDLDLVINCINAPAVVLKNTGKLKKSISISFQGDSLNSWGIGSKAYVFAKGTMQLLENMATRGFQSSCEPRLHFGLDTSVVADSVLIIWPDQKFQVLYKIPAGPLTVQQKNAAGIFSYDTWFRKPVSGFTDITSTIPVNWKHQENIFYDYNVQYLIPHGESTRGPKLAVADVNQDGLDDFYVCGAKGQAGQLMVQQKNGSFVNADTALFKTDAAAEDVDALFFDANGDKYTDLLVISGGNEYRDGESFLKDRLYLNNGKGNFLKSPGSLPDLLFNKSTVSAADIDMDGDTDLFIGNLANPVAYGLPQTSWLLLNDGKGNFKVAGNSVIQLEKIGLVTTSAFADLNNDSWPDLVVAGEWMPIKIFMNKQGRFFADSVSASTGLWQSVVATDLNGDGNMDLLAGNFGHNSKLFAGKTSPLKLYVKDFDKNGSIEQVMAYKIDDEEYPFLAKDELERALPVLKKAYLSYGKVAGKTVNYIFYDLFTEYTELKAETLASAYFINDGKGKFTMKPLPDALQMAPVFSFTAVNSAPSTFLGAGNFYNVIPYEGRYDALVPTVFSFSNAALPVIKESLPRVDGEIRDMKWLKRANGDKVLILARNNQPLIFLKTDSTIN